MAQRNYTELEQRIQALKQPDLTVTPLTSIQNYPLYGLQLGNTDLPTVFLTGGMHGDEPAGIEAVFRFLEQDLSSVLLHYSFYIMPCINPTGYVANTRENAQGEDINRAFDNNKVPEANAIMKAIKDQRFVFHLDMHEDYDADGSYFYEGRKDNHYLVPSIAQQTLGIGPFNTLEEEGQQDQPIADGVYQVDPAWGLSGLVCYTLAYNTDHVIMPETPSTPWELDRRIAVHLLVLDQLLTHYAK